MKGNQGLIECNINTAVQGMSSNRKSPPNPTVEDSVIFIRDYRNPTDLNAEMKGRNE